MDKRGAIELSTNMIIVMIISIMLLAIGFFLVAKGGEAWEKEWLSVKTEHERQIRSSMVNTGQLAIIYPNSVTTSRGSKQIFTLGINNELGRDSNFKIVAVDATNIISPAVNKITYYRDITPVKAYETQFFPMQVIIDRIQERGSLIFNICVYKDAEDLFEGRCPFDTDPNSPSYPHRYGDMQKIVVNVK